MIAKFLQHAHRFLSWNVAKMVRDDFKASWNLNQALWKLDGKQLRTVNHFAAVAFMRSWVVSTELNGFTDFMLYVPHGLIAPVKDKLREPLTEYYGSPQVAEWVLENCFSISDEQAEMISKNRKLFKGWEWDYLQMT